MLLGVGAAILAPEPPARRAPESVRAAVVEPLLSFASAFGPRLAVVLFVALLFRLPDLLGNKMTMPFLRQEIGFDIAEIGTIRQALGFAMTIVGAVIGGLCVKRWGLFRALVVFGILQVASNAGYLVLIATGKSLAVFAGVVVVENLCNGLVSAAFVAYFMTLCEPRFAAAQYAILSGLMYLAGALVGATSGYLVERLGYSGFFLLSIAVGVPPLIALPWAMPRAQRGATPENPAKSAA
jgi:PAT family beta-lactamase induction signal transducer AmpG